MQIISTLRSLFGFTQKELAEYLHVTQGFLALLEKGSRVAPPKSQGFLDELTSRIPEMEAIDGSGFSDLFPDDVESEHGYWVLRVHDAERKLREIETDIEKFDNKRAGHMRVLAYSSSLPAEPADTWKIRSQWWELMVSRLGLRTGKLRTGIRQRLVVRKAMLETEISQSKEMLAYWTQKKEGQGNS
jgi:transcriptional regulator with XRE-family HTH domain